MISEEKLRLASSLGAEKVFQQSSETSSSVLVWFFFLLAKTPTFHAVTGHGCNAFQLCICIYIQIYTSLGYGLDQGSGSRPFLLSGPRIHTCTESGPIKKDSRLFWLVYSIRI